MGAVTGDTVYLVTGHYCPTDANPPGDADDDVTVVVCESQEEADNILFWYPDGTITHVVEHASEDSGGSSYLCDCAGDDTGRHSDWCSYLNLFVEATLP